MHRCLNVAEIVENIAEQTRNLVAFALTCHSFYRPAVNVLWREQDDLQPLLNCFPSNVWESPNGTGKKKFIKPPIGRAEWKRFLFHAALVRTFMFDSYTDLEPEPQHLSILALYRPTLNLFPGLRTLSIVELTEDIAAYAHLFIGPTLLELNTYCIPGRSIIHALECVRDISPSLRCLYIDDVVASTKAGETLSETLCVMNNLTVLNCSITPLSSNALRHLATLPNLEILSFSLRSPQDLPQAMEGLNAPRFPALHSLTWKAIHLSKITSSFVGMLSTRCLTSFSLELDIRPCANSLHSLFKSLAMHQLLQTLDITLVDFPPEPSSQEHLVDDETLQPLFALRNMHKFQLGFVEFKLSPGSVGTIAMAWPEILELDLKGCSRQTSSQITLESLILLAKFCRSLRRLSITINADEGAVLPTTRHSEGEYTNESLLYLDVGRSLITNPDYVASFLSDVFPNVEVTSGWPLRDDAAKKWSEVNRLKRLCNAVRSQERNTKCEARKSCADATA